MTVFKTIIIYLISLVQSLLGMFLYSAFLNPPKTSGPWGNTVTLSPFKTPGFWVAAVFLIGLCLLVMWMRLDEMDMAAALLIVDVILSPLAFLRTIVSIITWIATGDEPELDFRDAGEMGEKVLCFLIYHDSTLSVSVESPAINFVSQLFVVLPLSCLLSGSTWLFIACKLGWVDPLGITLYFVAIAGVVAFSLLFVYTKSTEVATPYSHMVTRFKNRYTGDEAKVYGSGYATEQRNGWHKTEEYRETGSYYSTPHYALHLFLCVLFSPILAACQVIGVIFAFIAIFTDHIYSCYGQMDYSGVPLRVLQYPLGFLCSFVIV